MRRAAVRIFLACALTVGVALADDRAEVDKARSAFLRRQYDEVERRLAPFADPAAGATRDAAVLPDAYFLLAAAYFRLGRADDAAALLEAMAAKRPDAEPDPLLLPPEVVDGFADAKGRIRERVAEQQKERERLRLEAEAARARAKKQLDERIAKLENLARVETIREPHSRWLAAVPFGVGQFQNGDKALGWVLLVGETLALVTCAATVFIYDTAIDDAYATRDSPGVSRQYLARASNAKTANVVSAITGLALGAAGLVEAQVNFVPEVTITRERTAGELGLTVGLSGRF
jgi:tetratricopeptide (TPR) repeat protein